MIDAKEVTFDQDTTFPVDVWTASDGKLVKPYWFAAMLSNDSNGDVHVDLQVKLNGEWKNAVKIAADDKITIQPMHGELSKLICSDKAQGSEVVLRLKKCACTASADWNGSICIWGEEA